MESLGAKYFDETFVGGKARVAGEYSDVIGDRFETYFRDVSGVQVLSQQLPFLVASLLSNKPDIAVFTPSTQLEPEVIAACADPRYAMWCKQFDPITTVNFTLLSTARWHYMRISEYLQDFNEVVLEPMHAADFVLGLVATATCSAITNRPEKTCECDHCNRNVHWAPPSQPSTPDSQPHTPPQTTPRILDAIHAVVSSPDETVAAPIRSLFTKMGGMLDDNESDIEEYVLDSNAQTRQPSDAELATVKASMVPLDERFLEFESLSRSPSVLDSVRELSPPANPGADSRAISVDLVNPSPELLRQQQMLMAQFGRGGSAHQHQPSPPAAGGRAVLPRVLINLVTSSERSSSSCRSATVSPVPIDPIDRTKRARSPSA